MSVGSTSCLYLYRILPKQQGAETHSSYVELERLCFYVIMKARTR